MVSSSCFSDAAVCAKASALSWSFLRFSTCALREAINPASPLEVLSSFSKDAI